MSPRSKSPRKPMKVYPRDVYDRFQVSSPKAATAPVSAPAASRGKLVSFAVKHPKVVAGGVVASAAGVGTMRYQRQKKLHDWANEKKETTMSKNLINPFEQVVVFGKAYPVKDVTNVRSAGALVHTGRGVGHGQRLTEIKNSKGGGGRATRLERYTGHHAKQSVGPFSKNGNIPNGARQGRSL